MRRRFVITIDGLDAAGERQFQEYIRLHGAWWHWINSVWLLTTKDESVKASEIRDKVLEINPKARIVVFEFPEDITWSSSGSKNKEGKKISDWLHTPWGDD